MQEDQDAGYESLERIQGQNPPTNFTYSLHTPPEPGIWMQHSTPQTPATSYPYPYPIYDWHPYSQRTGMPFETPTLPRTGTPGGSERSQPRNRVATGIETTKKPAPKKTAQDKLEEVLALLNSWSWSIGDLLWHLFAMQNKKEREFNPSQRHIQVVSKFLQGETSITVSKILELWSKSSYGLPSESHEERAMLFSTKADYRKMKYARPAITSLAAQLVRDKLIEEVKRAARRDAGLHTFTSSQGKDVSRYDLGSQTFLEAMKIFKETTPVTWQYLLALSTSDEENSMRERRPPEYVTTEVLSMIVYSRNMYAKLVALDKGVLNFACCANKYLFNYDSRMGIAPSYHSVYDALIKLAKHDNEIVQDITASSTSSWILRFDNVQHYVRPRNFRVGREAMMKVGTAATVFEFFDFHPAAVDINKKKEMLAQNKRKDLTFEKLMGMIDTSHITAVCTVQWLHVLVNFVPCLACYKQEVRKLYRNKVAKKRLPPRKTPIFPLPTNGHNETVTAELLKAILDFVKEMGYDEESDLKHLLHAGGDGLTYERMILLKNYMQFHDSAFQRLEWLQPFLEIWHTCWTDISRIYEAHWSSSVSPDPSTLGHSANQIKRKSPANLKKVDYYPYSELAYQILDARILDCWRYEQEWSYQIKAYMYVRLHLGGKDEDLLQYFEKLDENKILPKFDTLYDAAQILFKRYGHPHAFQHAMNGTYRQPDTRIPSGDPWTLPEVDASSVKLRNSSKKGKTKAGKARKKGDDTESEEQPPFEGDLSLAQSCRFMYDATLSREVIYATADGDVGRVWECLKSMIVTFAGSTHTKYMGYLLEMLCDLELESTDEQREAFLANWIINPSGEEGRFIAGDKFQEQLQDEMYEHIGRKDRGFDEDYMRRVIAPNAYRFVLVKKTVAGGLGLAARGGKHTEPHTNPEMIKLLQVYREHQLHMFRRGRTYGEDLHQVDDLGRGQQRLAEGKLASWVQETTRYRNLNQPGNDHSSLSTEIGAELEQLDKEVEAQQNQIMHETRTPGQLVYMPDGELIVQVEEDDGLADELPEELEDYTNEGELQDE